MSDETNITVAFGQRIRQLRLAKGLSQENLGELCSLDRTYISGIERGRRNVSLRNIALLAEALDVSLSQLFEGMLSSDATNYS